MGWEAICEAARRLKCNQRPSARPHKPLLLLYGLARWREGVSQLNFVRHADSFDRLVQACGTSSPPGCMDDPFWLLYKTEQLLWVVTWDGPYDSERRDPAIARSDPRDWRPGSTNLSSWNASGGFPVPMQQLLTDEPDRVEGFARILLTPKYFPDADLDEVRSHVGL